MVRKSKSSRKTFKVSYLLISVVLAMILLIGALYITYDLRVNERSGVSDLRTMVASAIENLDRPAPFDAKTGNYYFVDSKLMLPYKKQLGYLQYRTVDLGNDAIELTFTNSEIMNLAMGNFRAATTIDEFMASVPHVQACSRGITVHASKLTDTNGVTLYKDRVLTDGRTVYIYSDDGCPEAKDVLPAFDSIDSY